MSNINQSNFKSFCIISQQVQNIKQKINQTEVTSKSRVAFHTELEKLQDSIGDIRGNALLTDQLSNRQWDEMERQIISLYREVEENFERHEITEISIKALDLGKSVQSGKLVTLAKKVDSLKQAILFLFKHRRPSIQNRKIVNLALKMTEETGKLIQSKNKNLQEQMKLIYLLKTLLEQAVAIGERSISPEEGELAMELYEIADLFMGRKVHEGKLRLQLIRPRLTEKQKERLDGAIDSPQKLLALLLEMADGADDLLLEEATPSKQVIFALQA